MPLPQSTSTLSADDDLGPISKDELLPLYRQMLAIRRLEKRKAVEVGSLKQAVAAVSVGILNGKAVLDLNYQMDQNVSVDMNVVMTADGRFVEIQGTAEGEPYSRGALNAMLLLAEHGIRQLFDFQAAALADARL